MKGLSLAGGPGNRWLRHGSAFAKLAFWLALALVLLLCLLPGQWLPPQAFSVWDKAQHTLTFAALTGLGLWAYPVEWRWRLMAGLLSFGAAIELLQAASGWRHGDGLDLLANALGIVAAGALASILRCPPR
ncbi:VanZ family protein [Hydrogenophaga sp.]|uniref:VanZ family protein n=1 Tax=Hydrogenophaga sp. TaxID=1904254 RepID=UPI0019C69AC4|nr:VanZ family protein [Hydrogenophaga sp.]MBD3893195.1 VanZ family protein [Hydrogenophaga sp.]